MRESIRAGCVSGPGVLAQGTVGFEFCFKADDPAFAGHFPGRPLVPGVFQLEMARAAMEWTLGCAVGLREVSKAKFQRPILPGDAVGMELKWTEEADTILARADFLVNGQRAGQSVMRLWRKK